MFLMKENTQLISDLLNLVFLLESTFHVKWLLQTPYFYDINQFTSPKETQKWTFFFLKLHLASPGACIFCMHPHNAKARNLWLVKCVIVPSFEKQGKEFPITAPTKKKGSINFEVVGDFFENKSWFSFSVTIFSSVWVCSIFCTIQFRMWMDCPCSFKLWSYTLTYNTFAIQTLKILNPGNIRKTLLGFGFPVSVHFMKICSNF